MPTKLRFTPNLARHLDCPEATVDGDTLREVLEAYFDHNPGTRGYVLDDQGALRKHVVIFVNQQMIRDLVQEVPVVTDEDDGALESSQRFFQ